MKVLPVDVKQRKFTLYLFWIISIVCFIYLSSIELSLEQQAILCWGLVALLFIANKIDFFHTLKGRVIYLAAIVFISSRYIVWRTFDTLIYISPVDFMMMALVFFAEIQVTLVHLMSTFANFFPLNRKIIALPEDESLLPTVDIFLPTYTENTEIVEITATACTLLDYPKDKMNIYILDDGATSQRRENDKTAEEACKRYSHLQIFAKKLGIHYIAREKNESAKAGNINYAMARSQGDLILVLDCDHVPSKDFLANTVGQFIHDKKLFLVQTPHFFINPDPIEKGMGTFHKAPSESEMFYRGEHPALDFWNASYFCGSAALLRRTCLEEVGGISGETITEDAETSLKLHAKGYRSAYISRPMVCGLSPETFSDFIIQRTRWCQGMLQMGFLLNPLFLKGLTVAQRICYSSFYLFWFFGFSRFIFFLAPTLFLLFGFQIYHASSSQVMAYAVPHLVAGLLSTNFLFGKFRWPLFSELYESVQCIFLLPAVFGVIKNPRSPTFKITPKGEQLNHDFLSPLAAPFYFMFCMMLASIPAAIYRWFESPLFQDVILVCVAWLTLNLTISLASLGAFWERHQIRHHHRAWASGPVSVFSMSGEKIIDADLEDLSLTGLGLHFSHQHPFDTDDRVTLQTLDSSGKQFNLIAKVKRIIDKGELTYCGFEFCEQENNFSTLVDLVYGDSQRWVDFWDRGNARPNVMHVLYDFLRMGINGIRHSYRGLIEYCTSYIKKAAVFIKQHIRIPNKHQNNA